MKSVRFFDRRVAYSLISVITLIGMVAPGVLPAFASAASITSRKITLSTSAISTAASYQVSFTSPTGLAIGGGLFIDFCTDPIIGVTCTAPSGLSDTGTTGTGGTITSPTANRVKIVLTSTVTAAATYTATLNNITNPSAIGSFYARIYTYANSTDLATYSSPTVLGTVADSGGIAMAATNSIGVAATVMETMTFCVTGSTAPTAACGNAGSNLPGVSLGHGSPLALDFSATDTAVNNAELSTNAASGAVVNMTNSNTACGGLRRVSAGITTCDIAPVGGTSAAITAGTAFFGLNVGSATSTASGTASGTLAGLSPYSTGSQYGMNWVSGNASGVGSTYGDPIFNTSGAPVSNKYVPLTFAASASTSTPAGQYSATINLVATGTF